MLCFIFTRKKLLVGVQGKITEFLRFSGKPYIDYSGQRMYDIFDRYFSQISEEFFVYAKKNQLLIQERIPVVLSFPSETYQTSAGQQMINHITDRIEEIISPSFSIVANNPIHVAYLKGVHLQDQMMEEGCVVIEAIDGQPSLIYIYHPEDGLENGHIIPIERIGVNGSSQSLFQALEVEFGKMGLTLDQEDRNSLLAQIQQQPPIETFSLNKAYGAARMKLEVSRNSLQVDDPMLVYQQIFEEWLSEAKLEALNARRVFLVGENLKRGIIRSHIDKCINLDSGIEIIEHVRKQTIWKYIVKGALSSIPQDERVRTTNGTKYRRDEVLNKRNFEAPPSIREPFDQHYTPHIEADRDTYAEEVLKRISEDNGAEIYENTITTKQVDDVVDVVDTNPKIDKKEQENSSWMSRLGFQGSPYQINKASEDISFFDLYHVVQKWNHAPFNNYEVQDKVNQGKFILKYISKEELESSDLKSSFYYLFEKEKTYFGLESGLSLAKEGLYYLRPFMKGQTLGEVIRENKMDEKKSLAAFNSKDLKLIVTVLEAIQTLPVSFNGINEKNILIFKGRSWTLKREYYATCIGFSVEDCPIEDMKNQVHDLFDRSLQAGVYQQIRAVLEI